MDFDYRLATGAVKLARICPRASVCEPHYLVRSLEYNKRIDKFLERFCVDFH